MFSAWGDESGSDAVRDPGVYVLAASLLDPLDVGDVRDAMSALRRSQPKLHWSDESSTRRDQIIDAIADLPVEGLVVVRAGPRSDTSQHQRNKTLLALVAALYDLGCSTLTLESRGAADDRRDRDVLTRSRPGDPRLAGVRIEHVAGPKDPALWVADALCGVVTQARVGNRRYLNRLERRLRVHLIEA